MESNNNTINCASCEGITKKIDPKSIILSLIIIAAGLYILLLLSIDDPKSNMNMLRIVAGWTLAGIGIFRLVFKHSHWTETESGSPVRHRRFVYAPERFPQLKQLASDFAGINALQTVDNASAYVECFSASNRKYAAFQILQYDTFGDRILSPVTVLKGSRAADFISDVAND